MVIIKSEQDEIDYKSQKVWLVAGDGFEEKNILDGTEIFVPSSIGENHADDFEEICNFFGVPSIRVEKDFADYFSGLGMIVFSNGMKLGGQYFGNCYITEHLTKRQIDFFQKVKPIFNEYFYHQPNFFGTLIKNKDGKIRNLCQEVYIETLLKNEDPSKLDGQKILYDEIERQKCELESRKIV